MTKAKPHTPKAHAEHANIECGCWTGKETGVLCSFCNATYNLMEVLEFPPGVFACYDCGASVPTSGRFARFTVLSPAETKP